MEALDGGSPPRNGKGHGTELLKQNLFLGDAREGGVCEGTPRDIGQMSWRHMEQIMCGSRGGWGQPGFVGFWEIGEILNNPTSPGGRGLSWLVGIWRPLEIGVMRTTTQEGRTR